MVRGVSARGGGGFRERHWPRTFLVRRAPQPDQRRIERLQEPRPVRLGERRRPPIGPSASAPSRSEQAEMHPDRRRSPHGRQIPLSYLFLLCSILAMADSHPPLAPNPATDLAPQPAPAHPAPTVRPDPGPEPDPPTDLALPPSPTPWIDAHGFDPANYRWVPCAASRARTAGRRRSSACSSRSSPIPAASRTRRTQCG